MSELSKQILMTPPLTDTAVEAHLWIYRGYRVIPCQPGSKIIIRGFGPNLQDLTTAADIENWFRFRKCNLAVIPGEGGIILDFDQAEVYQRFLIESPEAASSYTEETPGRNGYHVFLAGEGGIVPRWSEIVPGLEIKRICLVYPSQIRGKQYKPVKSGEILAVNLAEALQGFATVKPPDPETPARVAGPMVNQGQNLGIIEKVKQTWPILSYLAYFGYNLKLTGQGRWRSGLCPWHNDKNPSFWLDTDKNLWGCHGCGAHGDVLNFHARRLGTSDQVQAARDLDSYSVSFAVPGGEHV